MITWPFPQWMSLIRSQWRSHWVCNCFPLGEMLTAIESHLTAEFADECSLSTEWSGLILLWVMMELPQTPKPSDQSKDEGDVLYCVFLPCRIRGQILVDSLQWHQTLNIISHVDACSSNVSVVQMQSLQYDAVYCVMRPHFYVLFFFLYIFTWKGLNAYMYLHFHTV